MTVSVREILEGTREQGVEEEIVYTLTVPTTWGTPTGTPTVKAYSYVPSTDTYADVTSTVIPTGSATIASQVISLPTIKSLTVDTIYRVEVKFSTSEGDVKEAYGWILCKR